MTAAAEVIMTPIAANTVIVVGSPRSGHRLLALAAPEAGEVRHVER